MAYKTPGVYVRETRVHGKSVPTNDTANPFFIGFTQKRTGEGVVVKEITSLKGYIDEFGYGHYDLSGGAPTKKYYLFESIALYFANGGGACYVASVGMFNVTDNQRRTNLEAAFIELPKHPKANLIVVPDMAALGDGPKGTFLQNLLNTCAPADGQQFSNRFAVIDAKKNLNAYTDEKALTGVNSNGDHGAMYHPWIKPSVLSFKDVESALLSAQDTADLTKLLNHTAAENGEAEEDASFAFGDDATTPQLRKDALKANTEVLGRFNKLVADCLSLAIPPSGAVAGAYVRSDQKFGIQKAPANIALMGVKETITSITDTTQAEFNAPATNKPINCLRVFMNNGIRIWGARTLDGGSNDFRYISTRRTMSMIEQAVKNLMQDFIFEDNVPRTWIKIRAAVSKLLRGMLNRGVLAGSTPSKAFSLAIGLGQTMSKDDITDGIMRLEVKVALVRPAEFIEVSFEQMAQPDGMTNDVDPQLN